MKFFISKYVDLIRMPQSHNRLDPTGKNMTVRELVNKYIATKRGVKNTTRAGYKTVQKFLDKEPFGGKKYLRLKLRMRNCF